LTTSVTVRVVPFEIETLIEPAGTVPGAVHPASRAHSKATAKVFIVKETVRVRDVADSTGWDSREGERCRWTIVRLRERDAEMAHQSESGRNRNERQEHDRKARSYEETTGNPYHLSKAARTVVGVLALIVVIALTGLFVSGFIHW
jgi:hypothetical protein